MHSCANHEFDARLYQGFDEAKSELMTVIASELLAVAPETLKEKTLCLSHRANKFWIIGLGEEIGMARSACRPLVFCRGRSAVSRTRRTARPTLTTRTRSRKAREKRLKKPVTFSKRR
jgi:hypothetical protein